MRPLDADESATHWNIADDDRIGPVGRFLRRSSLDELPQLWNVVRGDMSLVGPRPERPHFVDQFASTMPRYLARHRVPCGMTGWSQVHGLRGDTSIADRARFDNYYIENWSLWQDAVILVRTVGAVARDGWQSLSRRAEPAHEPAVTGDAEVVGLTIDDDAVRSRDPVRS